MSKRNSAQKISYLYDLQPKRPKQLWTGDPVFLRYQPYDPERPL